MLGARYMEAGLGEPEQDANTALTELDKGLRSTKIGDQCEAIVRFPRLFEKYPFPILVNSSLLKLAEVFRVGNNILRLWILKVCEQTDKHLDKILNIEEFVRRIFIVYNSNDPVARGLALRTLGAVARIIPEKEQVHHGIRQSLDRHEDVEVDAAIAAALQFSAQSKTFAVSMCSKMSEMIEGQGTPHKRKIQLIPILRYMHHDANTAALVRSLCLNLLSKYPAQEFIIVTLDALTQLSIATLIDVPAQVNLLLIYLKDRRHRVRAKTLQCLRDIAKRGAVEWPEEAIESIITAGINRKILGVEKSMTLAVLLELSRSSVGCQVQVTSSEPLQMLLLDAMVFPDQDTACTALEVVTSVLVHCYGRKEARPGILENNVTHHLEVQLVTAKTHQILVRILCCAVKLSSLSTNYSEHFTEFMFGVLTQQPQFTVQQCLLVCEALAAIGSNADTENPLCNYLPEIIKKLEDVTCTGTLDKKKTQLSEFLFTLCMQVTLGKRLPESALSKMDIALSKLGLWSCYRVARCASRYGHHNLCYPLWNALSEEVWSEHYHFWFKGLYEMSLGEAIVQGSLQEKTFLQTIKNEQSKMNISHDTKVIERLSESIVHYNRAMTAMKAASSPVLPLLFQTEYLRLRLEMLQTLLQLSLAADLLSTSPPPAIAMVMAQAYKDDMLRFGQITTELRKCVKLLRNCEEMYSKLYQTSFDADNATLDYLKILQYLCSVMAESVDRMCTNANLEGRSYEVYSGRASTPETKLMLEQCTKILQLSSDIDVKPITPYHTNCIFQQINIICTTVLCTPRFFFQVLQGTSVKLAISPVPRSSGEPITHLPNTNLVIKVEGVVQHISKANSFRKVSEIHLTVTSSLQTRTNAVSDVKNNDTTPVLSQTVKPNRDYFSGSFLLTLASSGLWTVSIEASVIDEDGQVWKNGTRSAITVKVLEETNKPGTSQTSARR